MKTKLVYVMVSNEKDIYLERTLLSVFSARLYMPDVEIVLLVDELTDKSLQGKRRKLLDYITSKIVVNIDEKYNKKQRSRILKTSLREHVRGDFLFIDSDTLITSSLAEADEFDFDIGAAPDTCLENNPVLIFRIKSGFDIVKLPVNEIFPYYNSGVIYAKDNPATKQFFSDWHQCLRQCYSKGIYVDQLAFKMANIQNHSMIRELPCNWNCQMRDGLKYINDAKIIHFFTNNYTNDLFSKFQNKKFYLTIRENGDIDEQTARLIKNWRSDFANSTYIICNEEVDLWRSYSVRLLHNLQRKCRNLYNCIEFFSKLFYQTAVYLKYRILGISYLD